MRRDLAHADVSTTTHMVINDFDRTHLAAYVRLRRDYTALSQTHNITLHPYCTWYVCWLTGYKYKQNIK